MNINWKKIGEYTLTIILFLILNGFGIAIIIMLFMDPSKSAFQNYLENLGYLDKEQIKDIMSGVSEHIDTTSFFQELDFKIQAGIILGEIVGLIISIAMGVSLYNNKREDKRVEREIKSKKDKDNEKWEKRFNKYI